MPPAAAPKPTTTAALLRQLTIIGFPPAFILLFSHGIASGHAFPAIGTMPLAASAFLSLLLLHRDQVIAVGSALQALTLANILAIDVLLAAWHLGFLVPSWISLTWRGTQSLAILGAYGTVFMMADCGIHAYFVLLNIQHLLMRRSCDCAHCRAVMHRGEDAELESERTPFTEAGDNDLESSPIVHTQ